jgi:hypothetical protein
MSKDIIEFKVNGWPLALLDGKQGARMQDLELGRRAGLKQPRNIRQVIKKLQKRGRLPGICERTTVMRSQTPTGGERVVDVLEYWPNRHECLVIVDALETPPAEAMQDEMIHVFELALDGKLSGHMAPSREFDERIRRLEVSVNDARLCAVRAGNQVATLAVQLHDSIGEGGTISPARFNRLWADLHILADVEVSVGRWPTRRASLADIQREMRDSVEWGGKGQPWNEMKAIDETACRAVLRRRMKDATRKPKEVKLVLAKTATKTERQGKIDFQKPN